MEEDLRIHNPQCKIVKKIDELNFILSITPDSSSRWYGGVYEFLISCPEEYSIDPPRVRCLTKVIYLVILHL